MSKFTNCQFQWQDQWLVKIYLSSLQCFLFQVFFCIFFTSLRSFLLPVLQHTQVLITISSRTDVKGNENDFNLLSSSLILKLPWWHKKTCSKDYFFIFITRNFMDIWKIAVDSSIDLFWSRKVSFSFWVFFVFFL